MDAGKDLEDCPLGSRAPWLRGVNPNCRWNTEVHPVVQQCPQTTFRLAGQSSETNVDAEFDFPPTASLLSQDYGKFLHFQTAQSDPFYALHEVFKFCASSEAQFLNMMQHILASETGYSALQKSPTLSNLLYSQEILESHRTQIRNTLEVIRLRGNSTWPRATDIVQRNKADDAAESLQRDYEELLFRVGVLLSGCENGMKVMMNQASIKESELALKQGGRVAKLTMLAFFYIPFSFTTSFFGMNFTELGGGGDLRIWIWFATSIPVFLFTLIFLVVNVRLPSRSRTPFRRIVRQLQDNEV